MPASKRALICATLASFAVVTRAQVVGFCAHKSNVGQACEWTGDCDVPGCMNRCQPNQLVGDMRIALESAAYATDWWQMCPDLARYIRVLIFSANGEDPSLIGPPPGSLGGGFGALSPGAAPAAAESDSPASAPISLFFGEGDAETPEGEAEGRRRMLSYEEIAGMDLRATFEKEFDLLAPILLKFALEMQDVFDTDARGEVLTSDQTSLQFILGEQENRMRVWMAMFLDPEALKAYFAANCTTQEMGGPSRAGRIAQFDFGRYTGDWTHNHIGTNDTFNVCRDKFGGYEEYARAAQIKDARCGDPFEDPGSYICFWSIAPYWWPTTEQCAAELATLHRQDPAVVSQVTPILVEVEGACKLKASETECTAVLSAEFEKRIDEVKELLTGNADVGAPPAPPTTSPPPTNTTSTLAGSDVDSAVAPEPAEVAPEDTGPSTPGTGGSLIPPGALGSSPEDTVPPGEISRSAAPGSGATVALMATAAVAAVAAVLASVA